MNLLYLDASAWVKRYYQETGTQDVQLLFAEGAILACASLGFVEVSATLSRKAKAKQIPKESLSEKLNEIANDWNNFIQIQFSNEVLQEAIALTSSVALRGADAIHLASAVVLRRSLPELDQFLLVASDNELLNAAESIGMATLNPVL